MKSIEIPISRPRAVPGIAERIRRVLPHYRLKSRIADLELALSLEQARHGHTKNVLKGARAELELLRNTLDEQRTALLQRASKVTPINVKARTGAST